MASVLRRFLLGFAGLVLALTTQSQAQETVIVFAAASLRTALEEANQLFLFENAMRVSVSYGASSALARHSYATISARCAPTRRTSSSFARWLARGRRWSTSRRDGSPPRRPSTKHPPTKPAVPDEPVVVRRAARDR